MTLTTARARARDAFTATGGSWIGLRGDDKMPGTVGYQNYIFTYTCKQCGGCRIVGHESWDSNPLQPKSKCGECGAKNRFTSAVVQPKLPAVLYIGHDRNKQMELFPIPPDDPAPAYFPYSTRSFVRQASRELGGCAYYYDFRGTTMGEPVFTDMCGDPQEQFDNPHRCEMLCGWTRGKDTCPLWVAISALCQTESEKRFVHQYLNLVKGRNFPMLIPQARIGIAERRRPDFVLFAPKQAMNYKWYAIELDGSHTDSDDERNLELEWAGYEVLSYRPNFQPGGKGYYSEVQRLLEKIHVDMTEFERNPSAVAVEREVHSYELASF